MIFILQKEEEQDRKRIKIEGSTDNSDTDTPAVVDVLLTPVTVGFVEAVIAYELNADMAAAATGRRVFLERHRQPKPQTQSSYRSSSGGGGGKKVTVDIEQLLEDPPRRLDGVLEALVRWMLWHSTVLHKSETANTKMSAIK